MTPLLLIGTAEKKEGKYLLTGNQLNEIIIAANNLGLEKTMIKSLSEKKKNDSGSFIFAAVQEKEFTNRDTSY